MVRREVPYRDGVPARQKRSAGNQNGRLAVRGRRTADRIRTRGSAPGKLDIIGAQIRYAGVEFLRLKGERERGEEKGQRPLFSTAGLRGGHRETTWLASR